MPPWGRGLRGRGRELLRQRTEMLRLLARGGRRLVVALVATVVVGAAIPPAVTLATGALVGGIPEAVRQGRGSLAAGDVLAAAGGTYAELYSIQARAYG